MSPRRFLGGGSQSSSPPGSDSASDFFVEPNMAESSSSKSLGDFSLDKSNARNHSMSTSDIPSLNPDSTASFDRQLSSSNGYVSDTDRLFSLRVENGEFSELVRQKSVSVQDFMKLTVVDHASFDDHSSFEEADTNRISISEMTLKGNFSASLDTGLDSQNISDLKTSGRSIDDLGASNSTMMNI